MLPSNILNPDQILNNRQSFSNNDPTMFFEDQQHNKCLPDLLVTTVQRTCHQCLFVHPLLELFQDARDRQGSHFGDKVKIVIHVDLSQLIPALFCHALDIIAVKIIHQLELPSL